MYPTMLGGLRDAHEAVVARSGFFPPPPINLMPNGAPPPSIPIYRHGVPGMEMNEDGIITRIQRGDLSALSPDEMSKALLEMSNRFAEVQRSLTSSSIPIRENLEAPAVALIPIDTPVRNMLPRTPGSGLSSVWKQITSYGGGWGSSLDQPGGGSATQAFFAESGAPAQHAETYATITKAYKLLGTYGDITGLALAAGRNYQDQLQAMKTNALRNMMLNEENALINGDSTATAAPWGDGSNALSFDGLINLITTGNGTPSAQVQTSVGALTFDHIDLQLAAITNQGAQDQWILMNQQEKLSMSRLAVAAGQPYKVIWENPGEARVGANIQAYVNPLTGEPVRIIWSRFLPAGTIIYGCNTLPLGDPALDVQVLPQVQLPELAPNQQIQGYVAQELAPTTAAPQVYPFIISVYEVLRMKSAKHFAKSTGVTAA